MALQIIFNPISGQFDYVNSSVAPVVQNPNFVATFNATTSWSGPSGGLYTITIPVATHGKGVNPMVQIMELNGSIYDSIVVSYHINNLGDISITVQDVPDLRFAGKITIAENN